MEYPPFHGGVGNYYYNLINNFDNKVDVFADKKSLNNSQTNLTGVNYVNLLFKFGPLKWIKIIFLISKIIKKDDHKIFWAGNILPIGSACWLASKLFAVKYFVSLHGLDWQMANTTFRKKWLAEKILSNALFVTVNSRSTLNLLPEKFRGKAIIIYPSVSINDKNLNDNSLLTYNLEAQKYFLIVGRLVKRKGQKQAILAWKKILTNHPEYKLAIVGDGPMLFELNKLIKENLLTEKVIILSNLKNEEVALLYKNAYCFLFPVQPIENDIEGFGIVCLEAQYFNLPVIATSTGGITEALNNSAFYMKTATPEEIYSAVSTLITNEKLRNGLIDKSQQNVKVFSWKEGVAIINQTIEKYE